MRNFLLLLTGMCSFTRLLCQNLDKPDSISLSNSRDEKIILADSLFSVPYTLVRFTDLGLGSSQESSQVKTLFQQYRDWGFNLLNVTSNRIEWRRLNEGPPIGGSNLFDTNNQILPPIITNAISKNQLLNRFFPIGTNISVNQLEKILHQNLVVPYIDKTRLKEPE